MMRFTIGTRGSALALAQAELTEQALRGKFSDLDIQRQVFVTRGDQKLDLSLVQAGEAGGKGLFTRELEEALLAGTIDVAVHSLKDLPGHNPAGLEIAAVLERASTADVLIARDPGGFDALPTGAVVGTSSVRRARQLRWLRPDLSLCDWRGNVQTRLRKLSERADVSAIVLAQAGLERLGFELGAGLLVFEDRTFHLDSLADRLLPAIGQGAIALQCRADREEILALLRAITHEATFCIIRAERELQRLLAGDCGLPIGVRAWLDGSLLKMSAVLFGPDGQPPSIAEIEGDIAAPEECGRRLHEALLRQDPGSV